MKRNDLAGIFTFTAILKGHYGNAGRRVNVNHRNSM